MRVMLQYCRMTVFVCQVHVSHKGVQDWYNFCRDLFSADLLHILLVVGGPGHIVARRKPGNAQGQPVAEQWCFGGVDLATGDFFLRLVRRRDERTLLPVIQNYVAPGTRVCSDESAAYRSLNVNDYVHETVNYSHHFMNPATGVHTNDIESRWVACKAFLSRRYGVVRHMLPAYLDEYMWRARHGRPTTLEDLLAAVTPCSRPVHPSGHVCCECFTVSCTYRVGQKNGRF